MPDTGAAAPGASGPAKAFGPLAYPLLLFAALLVALSASRALLVLAFSARVTRVPGWSELLVRGVQMDVVTASVFAVPAAIVMLALPRAWALRARWLLCAWFAAVLTGVVLMEAISFDFIEEYDNRPNRIFVEYVDGSKEVAGTLVAAYLSHLIAAAALCAAVFAGGWKLAGSALRRQAEWGFVRRACHAVLLLPVFYVGLRGTTDHRPVNPSTAAFSGEHLLNQLALNSTYSAAYAAYSMRKEVSASELYGAMPEAEIVSRVARYTAIAEPDRMPGDVPFLHVQRAAARAGRPRNLVIVLEESLGAEFVGCLGGLPLTPNFDALSREGLLLTRLYSTGTRTVRGIEATLAGFLPTPADAVVKLPRAQQGFFTMAALLREHGYATDFIYGGESHFDNMAAFMLGNGFERAFDESDWEDPAFRGTWGVSDEDLMRRAHEVFVAHGDTPFFALVLSTSNHSPFEFPEGRIELYDPEPATRRNAMKYADHAIGELFRLARQSDYFDDTVWVVAADHNTRVRGNRLIPVSKFRIPGLILAPGLAPSRYEKIASQIDLMPTALHLLGIEAVHPMIGRNLFTLPEGDPGRAILQYYDNHGFLVGDRLVVHAGALPAQSFRYAEGRLVPAALDPELARDALAHALLPELLYEQERYRLPLHTAR